MLMCVSDEAEADEMVQYAVCALARRVGAEVEAHVERASGKPRHPVGVKAILVLFAVGSEANAREGMSESE